MYRKARLEPLCKWIRAKSGRNKFSRANWDLTGINGPCAKIENNFGSKGTGFIRPDPSQNTV